MVLFSSLESEGRDVTFHHFLGFEAMAHSALCNSRGLALDVYIAVMMLVVSS